MQNNGILIAVGILVIILLGGAVSYFSYQETAGPSIYDGFAQCLKDKEVTFFGAFWCPHCQAQKNFSLMWSVPHQTARTRPKRAKTRVSRAIQRGNSRTVREKPESFHLRDFRKNPAVHYLTQEQAPQSMCFR